MSWIHSCWPRSHIDSLFMQDAGRSAHTAFTSFLLSFPLSSFSSHLLYFPWLVSSCPCFTGKLPHRYLLELPILQAEAIPIVSVGLEHIARIWCYSWLSTQESLLCTSLLTKFSLEIDCVLRKGHDEDKCALSPSALWDSDYLTSVSKYSLSTRQAGTGCGWGPNS